MRSVSQYKSFRDQIQQQAYQFLERVSKLSQDYHFTLLNKNQILQNIIGCFDESFVQDYQQRQNLPNFLQLTLNNQSEKRLKQKLGIKLITQVSGSTKLFGKIDESFVNQSIVQLSSYNSKSVLNTEPKSLCFQNPSPIWRVIQQNLSQNSYERKDSESCSQSRIYNENKKSYKLYPAQKKIQIVNYTKMYGIKNASQHYKIPSCKINLWLRSITKIKGIRGRKPTDPKMEQKVVQWLKGELDKGVILTQRIIREKAKQISGLDQFKASKGWLQKFFKRRPQLFEAYTQNRVSAKQQSDLEQMVKLEENSQMQRQNQNNQNIKQQQNSVYDNSEKQ